MTKVEGMSNSRESVLSQQSANNGFSPQSFEKESSLLGKPELQDLFFSMTSSRTIELDETTPEDGQPTAQTGCNGLHVAAERGDEMEVSRLLNQGGIDVNEKAGGHRVNRTPLHRAAGYGQESIVRMLLKVQIINWPFYYLLVVNSFLSPSMNQ